MSYLGKDDLLEYVKKEFTGLLRLSYSATHVTCHKYTGFNPLSEYAHLNLKNAYVNIIGRCDREQFVQDNQHLRLPANIRGISFEFNSYTASVDLNRLKPFISTRSPSIYELQDFKEDPATLDGKKVTDYGFEKFCSMLTEFDERLNNMFLNNPGWMSKEPIIFPSLITLTEQEPVDHTEFHLTERGRKLTIQ